jgi:hypothetical protein
MIVGRWLFIGFPRAKVLGAGMECGASCDTLPGNKLVINLEPISVNEPTGAGAADDRTSRARLRWLSVASSERKQSTIKKIKASARAMVRKRDAKQGEEFTI